MIVVPFGTSNTATHGFALKECSFQPGLLLYVLNTMLRSVKVGWCVSESGTTAYSGLATPRAIDGSGCRQPIVVMSSTKQSREYLIQGPGGFIKDILHDRESSVTEVRLSLGWNFVGVPTAGGRPENLRMASCKVAKAEACYEALRYDQIN